MTPDGRHTIYLAYLVHSKPDPRAIMSVYKAIETSRNCKVEMFMWMGDSLVSRARNRTVSQFYRESKCDYYMMWDDDIEVVNCSPEDNILDRLTAWRLPWVGALVSKTNLTADSWKGRCASVTMRDEDEVKPDNGLLEMRWLGAGITLVGRSAIEMMVKAYPELEYDGTDMSKGMKEWALFQPYIWTAPNGFRKYLSEDWAACQRYSDQHGAIFADTHIKSIHWGEHGYSMWGELGMGHRKE